MKKILFILLLAAAVVPFQNCSTPPDDEVPTDTTKAKVEPINTFKFNNIDLYKLKWDSTNMIGSYRPGTDFTTINVEGYSGGEYAAFILKFPGKAKGTFKYSTNTNVNIEVTTGQAVREKKYIYEPTNPQPGQDMVITVTQYDPVGGRIKGTFSALLQETFSVSIGRITAGAFEVVRVQDEQ